MAQPYIMKPHTFTILVIDDDTEDLGIFCDAIKSIGPPLLCKPMTKCRVALKQLAMKEIQPQLIFLDVHLDEMDGLECLRFLKENKDLSAIPVAMISEIYNERVYRSAMKLGAINYFKKPGLMEEVIDLIKSTLPAGLLVNNA